MSRTDQRAIEVVAAVILRGDSVLLCQRQDGDHLPLMWEFPGGKIDPGESPEAALVRELREELDVDASILHQVADIAHVYPEKRVRIRFYRADIDAEPRAVIHRTVRWVTAAELPDYPVPPANRSVVRLVHEGAFGET